MSLPASYFDRLYAAADDPWGFRDRPYEERKRALTMASLTRPRYRSVFEPGCSIGNLTTLLAGRADRVVAMDPAAEALRQASSVVPAHVELVCGAVPDDWPTGPWDLVVLSEVGYYLDGAGARRLAERAVAGAEEVAAVHWRHAVVDYPLGGDEVHATLASIAHREGMSRLVAHVEEDFLLDVWCRDGRSVARRSGLAA